MATVYAGNSGRVYRYVSETWSSIRNNSTGSSASDSLGSNTQAVRVFHTSGRGGDTFQINRSFFYFDTSGITGTLSDATLKIYGLTNGTADIIAVKSDAFGGDGGTALSTADYNNLDFSTAYSAELATWSTSGYNDITLNATALTDMKNNDAFIVCVIEHDHDYADSAPSGAAYNVGMFYHDYSGTSRDPYIDYTVSTGPVMGKVNSVTDGNIDKVNNQRNAVELGKINGITDTD